MLTLRGISVISLTPFTDAGDVDVNSLARLVDFYLDAGVHGITLLGIMGEANKLLDRERSQVIETVVGQVKGRVPVVVGCSAQGTHQSAHYAKEAAQLGADAIMLAPPVNQKNLELVYEHYKGVAKSVDLPLVIQDEPTTTGVTMPPAFFARLAANMDTARLAKLEEAPTTVKISRILEATDGKLDLFGGLGGMYFYEELARGAKGIMTGFAYPEVLVKVYELFTSGDQAAARKVFFQYLPLIRFEAQLGVSGVAIRKQTYKMRGAIDSSAVRLPAPQVDERTVSELFDLVEFLGLSQEA
ncbi:dihydrodipicolinate synthase family protein [Alicyclobacillus tolerans]|uniref:dihydrodipicolinate synthase family protein n=1 Tax=Alicyclobacillus tolerans TaxID=90970 RepID=UPI001F46843C|nr:dihydrodipicolinate synthase family protein [Alicyclobacillus tolerans]MCF8564314.1 dihydrodipicolinate synthase family protein [Alicyclobacillus tolerans]